ncbi:Sucraseferredoxin-like protein, partial [Eremomyces bilateralis CBS 781.70]
EELFSKTDPAIDGEDCEHDCENCSVSLPAKFKINEDMELYGNLKPWNRHILVATGKSDWKHDVADETDSIMQAIAKSDEKVTDGRLIVSASNMPASLSNDTTTVLLLPSFTIIDNVVPSNTSTLISQHINTALTNSTPLTTKRETPSPSPAPELQKTLSKQESLSSQPSSEKAPHLLPRPCPHKYIILLCSHRTRDARCGQSAPLLYKEFARHLRTHGLFRDIDDERPGGAGVYFVSHFGGHKFAANVVIYRRGEAEGDGATQCIWLGRVRPEDCENIVRYSVLKGKVVKPERQLRGGFDREKGVVSW